MPRDVELTLTTDPGLLCTVRAFVRSYIAPFEITEKHARLIVLAVDEACTNVIRHAYEGRRDQIIGIAFRSDNQWLEIRISDKGRPGPSDLFKGKRIQEPDPETIRPGGLGLPLILSVFDHVEFLPDVECGNTLILRLKHPDMKVTV